MSYKDIMERDTEQDNTLASPELPSLKGHEVGKGRVDFFVLNEVILELKAVESMNKVFDILLLTYLKALEKKVGLIINFNVPRLKDGIKRIVL